jgi:acid phosphatase type 7
VAASNGWERRRALALGLVVLALVVGGALLLTRQLTPSAGPGPAQSQTAAAPSRTAPAGTAGATPPGSTAGAGSTPGVVLVGAGDIASCASDGDTATAKLLDGIAGIVFTLGDNVYERGTNAEFRRCYGPTWGRQLSRTMPTPGNHDYGTPNAAGYFRYFGAAAGDPAKGWYAYDAGTWRVYVLNSNCADIGGCKAGSAQERWLRQDLAENPRPCVLAMWHHPRFSSGPHGNNPITQPLWEALYEAGADLILNGHDHTYERFAPQTPTGAADPEHGIVEMVVGTGGRSHYDFPTARDNSLVRDNTTFGVLRLVLASGGWSFQFIPAAGGTFTDSGSGTCH